jgi:uncharacterized protein YgiM (DUF1202 family)
MSQRTPRLLAACVVSSLCAAVALAAGPATGTIAVNEAMVMSRPTQKSRVVSTVSSQTIVDILDREGEWLWIVLPPDANRTRRAGWIPAAALEPKEGEPMPAHESVAPAAGMNRSQARANRRLQRARKELDKAQQRYQRLTDKSDTPPDGHGPDSAEPPE